MFHDLQDMIDQGYVTQRKHPTLDLWIYNYSAACQFERKWTPTTIACRGLVLDQSLAPVARSLPKFFNREEHTDALPDGDFIVTDKLDGSMILLFWYQDQWVVATRGSFESEQAAWARQILETRYQDMLLSLDQSWTYVFELIHPSNRIVVDYGSQEDLIFLTAVDPETGTDVSHDSPDAMAHKLGILTPVAKTYEGIRDVEKIKEMGQKNQEGFVIRWLDTNLRLKVKLDDYVRLHKLLTGVTPFRIWDMLQSGQDFTAWLEGVPDEFYKFVSSISTDLQDRYNYVVEAAQEDFSNIPDPLASRKEIALYVQKCRYPSVMFKMLDQKPYSKVVWDMLRPRGDTKPLRCAAD